MKGVHQSAMIDSTWIILKQDAFLHNGLEFTNMFSQKNGIVCVSFATSSAKNRKTGYVFSFYLTVDTYHESLQRIQSVIGSIQGI